MGLLRLTDAQWTAVQANAERPRINRIFKKANLGQPAPFNASGPTDPATATHWVFDDHRLAGYWRVRVAAGPTIFFQEWDDPLAGTMIRELTLTEMNTLFGSTP